MSYQISVSARPMSPFEWGPILQQPDRIDITASRNCYWKSWLIGRVEQRTDRWDAIVIADGKRITISTTEAPNPEPAMHDVEGFIKYIKRITL